MLWFLSGRLASKKGVEWDQLQTSLPFKITQNDLRWTQSSVSGSFRSENRLSVFMNLDSLRVTKFSVPPRIGRLSKVGPLAQLSTTVRKTNQHNLLLRLTAWLPLHTTHSLAAPHAPQPTIQQWLARAAAMREHYNLGRPHSKKKKRHETPTPYIMYLKVWLPPLN